MKLSRSVIKKKRKKRKRTFVTVPVVKKLETMEGTTTVPRSNEVSLCGNTECAHKTHQKKKRKKK